MISEIFPEDKRRLHELEEQLTALEQNQPGVNIFDLSMGLDEMSNRLIELETLVNNEPKARRDDYRRKVTHLKQTYTHIKQSFDLIAKRNGVNLSLNGQKAELFTGAAMTIGENSNNPNVDLEMAESGSLNSSNRMVQTYLQTATETLGELHAQRDRLKGVRTDDHYTTCLSL